MHGDWQWIPISFLSFVFVCWHWLLLQSLNIYTILLLRLSRLCDSSHFVFISFIFLMLTVISIQYFSQPFKANCIFPASSDIKAVSSVKIRPEIIYLLSLIMIRPFQAFPKNQTSLALKGRRSDMNIIIKEYRTQWTPLPRALLQLNYTVNFH